jgi:hypothetical protein
MADYHPLISRAVGALEKDTAENRRALYERARTALVSQLRGTVPPLEEAEITRERLALEEAIRKVEVESARRAREAPKEPAPLPPKTPPQPPTAPPPARLGEPMRRASEPEPMSARREMTPDEPAVPSSPPPPSPPPLPPVAQPASRPAETVMSHAAPSEISAPPVLPPEDVAQPAPPSPPAPELPPIPAALAIDRPPPVETSAPQIAPADDAARRENDSKFDEALKRIRDVAGSLRQSPGEAQPKRARPVVRPLTAPGPRMIPYGDEAPFPSVPAESEAQPAVAPDTFPAPAMPEQEASEARGDDSATIQAPQSEPDWAALETEQFKLQRRRGRDDDEQIKLPAEDEEEPTFRKPPALHSYRRALWIAIVLAVVFGAGALAYWEGPGLFRATKDMLASLRSTGPSQPKDATPAQQKKNADRIPSDSRPAKEAPATQRAMLTTEDPNSASGRDYVGTAKWRVETKSPPGRQPELELKLEVEIPDRGFAMTWTIKRNTDPSLPATHTIDIEFNIADNSPLGSISEIKSLLMKKPTETEGKPLWGHAQKSTPNYFLVGLSASPADAQHNIALLKEQPAFDMALVFSKARRAFLLIEKGPGGEKAFADAFAAWKQ